MENYKVPYPKTTLLQKIALITLGFFLSLVLIEGGLRLGERIFFFTQEHRNTFSIKKEARAYRILCLGESMVALGGDDSFPSQLESVLNRNDKGIRFSVINKGIPGSTTSVLLEQLEKNINQYGPQMVIAMMGINDIGGIVLYKGRPFFKKPFLSNLKIFNLIKFIELCFSKSGREGQSFARQTGDLFDEIHATREAKEGMDRRKASRESAEVEAFKESAEAIAFNKNLLLGWDYQHQHKYKEAERMFEAARKIDPDNGAVYMSLGWCYNCTMRWDEAEKMFKKAIEVDPGFVRGYVELAEYYIQRRVSDGNNDKIGEGKTLLEKAIELDDANDRAYGGLGICCRMLGEHKLADEYFKKAECLRNTFYTKETVRNYLALKASLDRHGIKLVVVAYPMRGIGSLKKIFTGQKGTVFVDNETIFKNAVQKASFNEYFYDAFAGDFGHCSAKGNKLLADNVAAAVLKEVVGK